MAEDLVIRVAGHPLSLAVLQEAIWAVDRELPISGFQTMEQILDSETLRRRMQMSLLGAFAGLALLLVGLGIYGVMSYAVAQRTHEIGIRMALGAERGEVLRMVIGQGIVLALLGVGFGLVGAAVSTRFLASLLFGTTANDLFAYFPCPRSSWRSRWRRVSFQHGGPRVSIRWWLCVMNRGSAIHVVG